MALDSKTSSKRYRVNVWIYFLLLHAERRFGVLFGQEDPCGTLGARCASALFAFRERRLTC